MREIKFRAWDKKANKMYPVKELCLGKFSYEKTASNYSEQPETGYFKFYPKIVEIMQYTGLKDKNGVEIYEGDIVEYKAYQTWHTDEVKYTDGRFHGQLIGLKEEFRSMYDLGLIVALGCEVIGNIYENPELLETNDKEL